MKKENIIELNIGVYKSIKLQSNRMIAMTVANRYPELASIKNEKDVDFEKMYAMSIYCLYKMANSLDEEFTYEKAKEIFEYASHVKTIVNGEKQYCDIVLMGKVLSFLQEVFTKEKGEDVETIEFSME